MFKIEDMGREELNGYIESVFKSMLEPEEKSEVLKKAYARLNQLDINSALVEHGEDVDFE